MRPRPVIAVADVDLPDEGADASGDGDGAGAGQDCAAWDVECRVVEAFRGWIAQWAADLIDNRLMEVAVTLMLMTPQSSGLQSVWSTALAVVNTAMVLVVTLAGVWVMGQHSVQSSTGIKEVLPRLVLAFIAANASWFVTDQLAQLGTALATALLSDVADAESVTTAFERIVDNPAVEGLITLQLVLMSSVAALIFAFTVIVRIMLWVLLTAAGPLALAAHALPQTEGLARLWWRAIGALLLVQIAQALTLRLLVTLFLQREGMELFDVAGTAGSMIELGVLVACLYVLIRIPFWAGKRVFNYQASPLVKGAKLAASVAVGKVALGAATAGKASAGKRAAATTTRPTPAHTTARSTGPAGPAQRGRWVQPELPGMPQRSSGPPRAGTARQDPLPGIDRQIDPGAQQRMRQRQRWVQPRLPSGQSSRPSWHRQDPLPGMETYPRGRQEPIPDLTVPPQTRTEPLFGVTEQMRRPPGHRGPGTAGGPPPLPSSRPVRPRPRRRPPEHGGSR